MPEDLLGDAGRGAAVRGVHRAGAARAGVAVAAGPDAPVPPSTEPVPPRGALGKRPSPSLPSHSPPSLLLLAATPLQLISSACCLPFCFAGARVQCLRAVLAGGAQRHLPLGAQRQEGAGALHQGQARALPHLRQVHGAGRPRLHADVGPQVHVLLPRGHGLGPQRRPARRLRQPDGAFAPPLTHHTPELSLPPALAPTALAAAVTLPARSSRKR